MKITREWLGGSEEIDLGTEEGWAYWVNDVQQDDEVAQEVAERIDREGEVVINASEAEFIERYTKTGEAA